MANVLAWRMDKILHLGCLNQVDNDMATSLKFNIHIQTSHINSSVFFFLGGGGANPNRLISNEKNTRITLVNSKLDGFCRGLKFPPKKKEEIHKKYQDPWHVAFYIHLKIFRNEPVLSKRHKSKIPIFSPHNIKKKNSQTISFWPIQTKVSTRGGNASAASSLLDRKRPAATSDQAMASTSKVAKSPRVGEFFHGFGCFQK